MEEDEEFNRALMPELDAPLSLTPGDQQLTLPEGGKEEAHRGEIGSDPVGLSPAAISRQEEQPTKGEENEVEKGKQDLGEQKRNEPNIQYEALQSDKGRLRKRKQPESQTSPPPQDLDVLIRTHLYREWQQSHDDLVVEDR